MVDMVRKTYTAHTDLQYFDSRCFVSSLKKKKNPLLFTHTNVVRQHCTHLDIYTREKKGRGMRVQNV